MSDTLSLSTFDGPHRRNGNSSESLDEIENDVVSSIADSRSLENAYDHEGGQFLLSNTNHMLSIVGIKAKLKEITSIDELTRVASSMFVATYESLFHVKVEGIIRHPLSLQDYAENAQLVVESVADRIDMDLQHISGYDIVNGDLRAISNLVNIFIRIASITGSDVMAREFLDNQSIESRDVSRLSGDDEDEFHDVSMGSNIESADKYHPGKNISKEGRRISRSSRRDSGLYQNLISQKIQSNEAFIKQSERIAAADRRRLQYNNIKSNACRRVNALKQEKTERVVDMRRREEKKQLSNSEKLRVISEEDVAMRKIQRRVMKKLHEWHLDEDKNIRNKVKTTKVETLKDTLALQRLFEDRISMVREALSGSPKFPVVSAVNWSIDIEKGIHKLVRDEYHKVLAKYNRDVYLIETQRELRTARSFKVVMGAVTQGNWRESLRNDRGFGLSI